MGQSSQQSLGISGQSAGRQLVGSGKSWGVSQGGNVRPSRELGLQGFPGQSVLPAQWGRKEPAAEVAWISLTSPLNPAPDCSL